MSSRRKQVAMYTGSSDVTFSGGAISSCDSLISTEEPKEGYDYEFVPAVEAKYECPICLMVLRHPMQTTCGHRFCQVCIMRWLREKQTPKCPVDNNPLSQTQLFPDNFAKREIMLLDVRCPNWKHGCTTVCELKQLEHHLEADCDFVLVPCPNLCPAIIFKHLVGRHLKDDCSKRCVKCKRCQLEVTYQNREEHIAQCPEVEEECIHCRATVVRKDMAVHQASQCLKAPADCIFNRFGCKGKLPREDMEDHMKTNLQSHLVFVSEAVSKLIGLGRQSGLTRADWPVSHSADMSAESKLATTVTSGFVTMPTVTQTESDGRTWNNEKREPLTESAVPASHQHLASLLTDGVASTATQLPALSELVALLQHSKHQDITLAKHEQQLSELQTKLDSYEKQAKEQSTRLREYEQTISDFESRFCNGQFLWKVQSYSQLRHDAISGNVSAVHSPGFYTSFHGYKLCVRLNPNGVESGTGTHISLFIHFMKGSHDTLLDWPFAGKITLYILDQNDNPDYRQHISETLVAKPGLAAFQKPVSSRNHKGFGYIEFAPISLIEGSAYVRNDTLLIKASVVEH